VLLAAGYQIGLYSVPQVIRQVSTSGPWDMKTAFKMMEGSFRPAAQDNVIPTLVTLSE
jgi:hypothetical protein